MEGNEYTFLYVFFKLRIYSRLRGIKPACSNEVELGESCDGKIMKLNDLALTTLICKFHNFRLHLKAALNI